MTLKDIELKASYDSDEDDILNEFYIPALSNSITYKRLAGFFSSNSFAIAAKGISKFILNGGKIELIANVVLSKQDYELIKDITEKSFIERIEKDFIESLGTIEDQLIKNHIKMLGWMLRNGKLEIKIAVVKDDLTSIQHQKTGILEDEEGNIISFSGSDNETKKGWLDNIEEFHVFCNWKEGDQKHIEADIERFEKFWSDTAKRTRVYPVSEAVKLELIKIAPKNDTEFEKLTEETTRELLEKNKERTEIRKITKLTKSKDLILRDYQNVAIENWFKNNKRGFFRMATGTGKTETSIGVIKRLFKNEDRLFVIIAVHGQSLLYQWIEKLKDYGYESEGASSKFKDWRKRFREKSTVVSLGYENNSIFITTYQTFSSDDFIEIAKTLDCKVLLICDEVHHAGADTFRKGLLENYLYRLGLSATPERWFDDNGTKILNNYFDKTVYTFSMRKAMSEINPSTRKPYLCKYKYYPIIVDLSPDENERFIELTKKISRRFHTIKGFNKDDKTLNSFLIMRADIKKNAKSKMSALENLFNEIGDSLEYCIIYCSGKQMNHVKELLQKHRRIYSEFTQHQKAEVRSELLKKFELGRENGGYDVLLAIDCLNEGIDVPSARIGIFLENSLNPIEFIQRRGRMLRQSDNKEEAVFYDFIVETNLEISDDKYAEVERKEMQKEFDRFVEFAHLASNVQEAMKRMDNIINRYNLIINIKETDTI
ncbi:MAG: DEAD/DEAH box helicase family protein [Candidatus Aenigmatarchaeota archaeon]